MCKCPNDFCFPHHEMVEWDPPNRGGDFRWIYENRQDFWFGPVYIPTVDDFMKYYNDLGGHVPTTGYSCILDVLRCDFKELYITGFDGFHSKTHNINEGWRDKKHRYDPVCHVPEVEIKRIKELGKRDNIKLDRYLCQ